MIYIAASRWQDEWREEIKKMHTHTRGGREGGGRTTRPRFIHRSGFALIKLISEIPRRSDTPARPTSGFSYLPSLLPTTLTPEKSVDCTRAARSMRGRDRGGGGDNGVESEESGRPAGSRDGRASHVTRRSALLIRLALIIISSSARALARRLIYEDKSVGGDLENGRFPPPASASSSSSLVNNGRSR